MVVNYTMIPQRSILISLVALTFGVGAPNFSISADDDDVVACLTSLCSAGSPHEKAMTCKRLATIGDQRAVKELSALLNDAQVATYAREALELIPGNAADSALRDSLPQLSGDLRVGVIDSIGKRRNASAVPILVTLVSDQDDKVAKVAIRSLGKIGQPAVPALKELLLHGTRKLQSDLAWACLDCAIQVEKVGDKQQAAELYNAVRIQKVPQHIQFAATMKLAATQEDQGVRLLTAALASGDNVEFRSGLLLARSLGEKGVSALADFFREASVDRKELIVCVLTEHESAISLSVVLEAADDRDPRLRRVAFESLGTFKSDKAAEKLLTGISDKDAAVQTAAADAVARSQNLSLDDAIIRALQDVNSATLPTVLDVVRRRRIAASPAHVFALTDSNRPDVRAAAIRALGATIELADVPRLISLAVSAQGEVERAAAAKAMADAAARLPEDEYAKLVAKALEEAAPQHRVMLMEQLARTADHAALRTLAAASQSDDKELKDAAVRLLGKWPNSDAAAELYRVAADASDSTYQVRALRGYIRIARQLNMPADARVQMCANALKLATRPEEKALILEALRRHPSAGGIDLTSNLLSDNSQASVAVGAILEIAKAISKENTLEAAESLQKTLKHAAKDDHRSQLSHATSEYWELNQKTENKEAFVRLFDGKSLKGWDGPQNVFHVENDEIVGGQLDVPIKQNEFLTTATTFDNFELRLQFKLVGKLTNAGVQFRSARLSGSNEVCGYQADLGNGYWGCLYDESRRARVLAGPTDALREDPVNLNDWNAYRIRCEANRIRIWINGVPTVDYVENDPTIPRMGVVGLQVHAGEPMEARYRDIRLKVLDP